MCFIKASGGAMHTTWSTERSITGPFNTRRCVQAIHVPTNLSWTLTQTWSGWDVWIYLGMLGTSVRIAGTLTRLSATPDWARLSRTLRVFQRSIDKSLWERTSAAPLQILYPSTTSICKNGVSRDLAMEKQLNGQRSRAIPSMVAGIATHSSSMFSEKTSHLRGCSSVPLGTSIGTTNAASLPPRISILAREMFAANLGAPSTKSSVRAVTHTLP
mmetsp:Transcript_1333/g.3863  ORF Transcript_1333/g.3863 Transcript_1333/m.3863 type:complete len:215 (-) Transcript_1333:2593-3237(-)